MKRCVGYLGRHQKRHKLTADYWTQIVNLLGWKRRNLGRRLREVSDGDSQNLLQCVL